MPTNLSSFSEARDARLSGEGTLEECLRHIVAYYKHPKHTVESADKKPWQLPSGFECEVRDLLLSENYEPPTDDDTTIILSIFLSGFQGDVLAIRKLLESSGIDPIYYLRPLTSISSERGDTQLLRFCFEIGFSPDYFDSIYFLGWRSRSDPSMEWLDVLFDLDFCKWRTNPQQLNRYPTWSDMVRMGPDATRWWIDHGGSVNRCRGLFWSCHKEPWPGAATFRVLLNHFGIDWFRDSGTLQLAVENHDLETVKILLEAGADVNEDVTDWNTDIREHRAAPLPALATAMYAKSDVMIRYLAEHGAKLRRYYVEDPYKNMPEEFKPFRSLVVELGAVEE
ncbi:hypothetical protein J4E91_004551 [Alternaria rosae]|nr:hypothetical protein J4E91_004551 [Alternaria rosae]